MNYGKTCSQNAAIRLSVTRAYISPSWVTRPMRSPRQVTPREIGIMSPLNLGACHATGHTVWRMNEDIHRVRLLIFG